MNGAQRRSRGRSRRGEGRQAAARGCAPVRRRCVRAGWGARGKMLSERRCRVMRARRAARGSPLRDRRGPPGHRGFQTQKRPSACPGSCCDGKTQVNHPPRHRARRLRAKPFGRRTPRGAAFVAMAKRKNRSRAMVLAAKRRGGASASAARGFGGDALPSSDPPTTTVRFASPTTTTTRTRTRTRTRARVWWTSPRPPRGRNPTPRRASSSSPA